MNQITRYGPIKAPGDTTNYARIVSESFGSTVEEARSWIDRSSPDRTGARLLRHGDEVVAGLTLYEGIGQWFGGRRVSSAGVAGVGSSASARGKGFATELMRAAVRELHREGVPLACLYPATVPLYRRAGFELAGSRWEIQVPAADLNLRDHELLCRPATEEDAAGIEEAHRAAARRMPGQVDRNPALWRRIRNPEGKEADGYVVIGSGGRIEGYVYLQRKTPPGSRMELRVSDLVAVTQQAATRLLTFLGDHRSIVGDVFWYGSAADPLLTLLREASAKIRRQWAWMLRLVDVPAALKARGWPVGIEAEVHLELSDDVIPENAGRFVLEVSDGIGRVRQGGDGRLQLDVRALAALYSGQQSPEVLFLSGHLAGEEKERGLAAALFAGPPPAMTDFF